VYNDDNDGGDDYYYDNFLVKATFFKDETLGSLLDTSSSQLPNFWRQHVL
jgi:hypothetical protein